MLHHISWAELPGIHIKVKQTTVVIYGIVKFLLSLDINAFRVLFLIYVRITNVSRDYESLGNYPMTIWDKAFSKIYLEKFKARIMGVVQGKRHIFGPVFKWFASFSFNSNHTNNSRVRIISKFDKVKVIVEVKGQVHIFELVSKQRTSYLLYVNLTYNFWGMAYRMLELENINIWNFQNKSNLSHFPIPILSLKLTEKLVTPTDLIQGYSMIYLNKYTGRKCVKTDRDHMYQDISDKSIFIEALPWEYNHATGLIRVYYNDLPLET